MLSLPNIQIILSYPEAKKRAREVDRLVREKIAPLNRELRETQSKITNLSDPLLAGSNELSAYILELTTKRKLLLEKSKFETPAAFLEYEIETALDNMSALSEHLDKPLPCKKRFDFILSYLNLSLDNLPQDKPVTAILRSAEFAQLYLDFKFRQRWYDYEHEDPLWGSYELQILN